MLLNLRKLPAVKGTVIQSTTARGSRLKNYYLTLPAFATTYESWYGASEVVAVISIPITTPFAFTVPITFQSYSFCPCIKWVVGTTVYRYKLWEGVGEVLPAPLYIGEAIPAGAIIEIWTSQADRGGFCWPATMDVAWTLQLGFVLEPSEPCDFTDQSLATGTACIISATYPTLAPFFTSCA